MIRVYERIQFLVFISMVGILMTAYLAVGDEEPENLALEMPVTMGEGFGEGTAEMLTDGDTVSDPYLGGPVWVQVDLEDYFLIDTIKLWHFYSDGRTYHDNKVALSDKGDFQGEEIVVFDTNGNDAEYPETAQGRTITFDPVEARYIRAWVGGSTANEWSHWVELQAFFVGQQPVRSIDKLPTTWGRIKSR